MNTNGRILSIFVFMAVATTALTFGTSTTFAASIQLTSGDYLPTFAANNSHTQDHQNDTGNNNSNRAAGSYDSASPTQYESAQYAWSHPHHHHSSADQNDMIADTGNNNSNNAAGSYDSGSPTQYESAQYAWSHPHHHHSSADQNDTVGTSSANPTNPTSTADGSNSSNSGPTQYGSGSHPHHHHSSTDMIPDINGDNSAWSGTPMP